MVKAVISSRIMLAAAKRRCRRGVSLAFLCAGVQAVDGCRGYFRA